MNMMLSNTSRACFWVLFLSLLAACQVHSEPQAPPNVILIMADDLGYGDLSCYGNSSIRTPNIDQLAAEGIRFADYHSNGAVCSPTRAALLSGLYQQRVGIPGVVFTWLRDSLGMSTEVETLAEVMQSAGYRTGIFGKWHLGYQTQFNPLRQGFDEFRGFVAGNVDYHSHLDNMLIHDWWRGEKLEPTVGYSTDLITAYARDFISRHRDSAFFLYVPHAAPHDPYEGRSDPPVRLEGKPVREVEADDLPGIYREMVEVMDEGIGQMLAALDSLGIADRTIVIFCSDNGANKRGSNGLLRGYKGGLYEGGHRVPAIIRWTGQIDPGQVSEATMLSMDWFPTICELADIDLGERVLDGHSFATHLRSGEVVPARTTFWQYRNQQVARKGNWKLIRTAEQTALFDLQSDISEQGNLLADFPEQAAELQRALDEWTATLPAE